MVSTKAQLVPAAQPAAGAATPAHGLPVQDGMLPWALQNEVLGNDSWKVPRDKPAASRSKDRTGSTGGGSGGGRAAASPAKPQQALRPTTSTAASHGSKQPGRDPNTAGKPSRVQETASGKQPASAPTKLQPGKLVGGIQKPPLSKPAPSSGQRNGASSKPTPALVAAVAVAGASAGANGRPPKRLKATLVTAVTLSDSSSAGDESGESDSGSGSDSDSDSGAEGEAGSKEATVAAITAWEVGLNGAALMPDEAGLLPPGASEAAYVRVSVAPSCRAGQSAHFGPA